MGKHANILKNLRAIALEYGAAELPDFASMARDLGRVARQEAAALSAALAPRRTPSRGVERWWLSARSKPALSMRVVAWPPNRLTPLQHHAGPWGLEMTMQGALEVQSYRRDARTADRYAITC